MNYIAIDLGETKDVVAVKFWARRILLTHSNADFKARVSNIEVSNIKNSNN